MHFLLFLGEKMCMLTPVGSVERLLVISRGGINCSLWLSGGITVIKTTKQKNPTTPNIENTMKTSIWIPAP